ncbi:hypothetical protein BSFA1_67610 (plasmid) [Burkholderia sp. SFA1]|uniref:hypothetical protein n=1 Tax=unclassified Caballeronia TaxID=2646786 RepID=UPI00023889B8|nr:MULTISPECIES: hypothetical protein [unclassified Caballeronia]AET94466.1 hypothetical protein BYI23_D009560 [Burkholderia sp. YI23]MCE4546537.1 hypothetical protein [Caballeronia sp. PC1]MCE4572990.1 hypothetical protein [Caballeronia sp. CLC5]BBQ01633.1 hypothetical protein BSFA1_67610 [Burkholderia sp. SFA1]
MKTVSLRVALGLSGLMVSALALAQSAPPCTGASTSVQVRDFTAVSSGSTSHFPGSRLRAARNTMQIEQNASALAEGIVRALNAKGIAACHLTAQAGSSAPPASGWLVTGEFDETLSSGFGGALPSMGSSDKSPNTHVTVQLANLAASPDAPLSQIDTSSQLKGQKSAAAPKPYGAAARFVIHKTEAISSLDALASAIADEIAAQKTKMESGAQ